MAEQKIKRISKGSKLEAVSRGDVVELTGFGSGTEKGRIEDYNPQAGLAKVIIRKSDGTIELSRYLQTGSGVVRGSRVEAYGSEQGKFYEYNFMLKEVGL